MFLRDRHGKVLYIFTKPYLRLEIFYESCLTRQVSCKKYLKFKHILVGLISSGRRNVTLLIAGTFYSCGNG